MADGGSYLEGIDAAATLAVLGIDPLAYLNAGNLERHMLTEVADAAVKLRQTLDQNLSKMIAFEVSKLFK